MSTPQPLGAYNVLLIGEALGEAEAASGRPFDGRAGFLLDKLIRHAGLERSGFGISNAVWCRPPDNKLSGMPYEQQAIFNCRERHLIPLLRSYDSAAPVLVPMGAVALSSLLGRRDIVEARGYVWPYGTSNIIYPTVHPSYILRGNAEYGTVFIHDLQQAVELARDGWAPAATRYTLDPTPEEAGRWVDAYILALAADPTVHLAYDIETPYRDEDKESGALDDDDTDDNIILRISFAYRAGEALSVPWRGEYMSAIRRAFATPGAKVVWNDGFDSPRIRSAGVAICGVVYDGMVAWHVLESDLPKNLRFVSSMMLPHQPPWKHLNSAQPAFYNATDSDVENQLLDAIFVGLRKARLWDVYDRHILQLTPLLARLSSRGMPVDSGRRDDFARTLASKQADTLTQLEAAVPLAARKVAHVYKTKPKNPHLVLYERPALLQHPRCSGCGIENPRKDHFRERVKRPNPCAGACKVLVAERGVEYYRLADWRPSKEQLVVYCQVKKITPPKRRDYKTGTYKVTFNADATRRLLLKYPGDDVFRLTLEWREIDKIAGTYIGRVAE